MLLILLTCVLFLPFVPFCEDKDADGNSVSENAALVL